MIELFWEMTMKVKNGILIKPYDRDIIWIYTGLVDAEEFFGINYNKIENIILNFIQLKKKTNYY
jgi:ABC-type lipoprotein release transport system permease subunit